MDTVLARKNMNDKNKVWQDAIDALIDPAADMDEEESAKYLGKIIAKLKNGKKLSADELEYLRLHEPQLYMTAMRVQHKKEALKHRLKNCKSKQEAQDIIDSAIGGISKEDPDKEYLIAGIKEIEKEFKNSKFYKRLPDTKEDTERQKLLKHLAFKDFDTEYENIWQNSEVINIDMAPIAELLDVLPTFEAKA